MSQSSSSSDSDSSLDPISLSQLPPTTAPTPTIVPTPSAPEPVQLIQANPSDSSQSKPNQPTDDHTPSLSNPIGDPPTASVQDSTKTVEGSGSSEEDDEDDDMDEVEAPDLGGSRSGADQMHKAGAPTAASRSWMSQRKGKAILIEGGDQPMIDGDREESGSGQRIRELGALEDQIATLLGLASKALECLSPPSPTAKTDEASSIESFSASISDYFATLNTVQLGLRTSISHLRAARISSRILFEPAHASVPESAVGLGSLNAISYLADFHERGPDLEIDVNEPLLSLDALVAERDGWKDLVGALKELGTQKHAAGNPMVISRPLSAT